MHKDTYGGPNRRKEGRMERHVQTVITMIIVAVLLWVGDSVSEGNVQSARLEERMISFSKSLDEALNKIKRLEGNMDDRYRRSDANRDLAIINNTINRIEQRVSTLEEK